MQADAPFRNSIASLQQIYVHNGSAATNIPTGTKPVRNAAARIGDDSRRRQPAWS